jgi:hypothetical protein
VVGNLHGELNGKAGKIYRSGLTDSIFRFSVNLIGGPAMTPKEMVKWRQKTVLGAGISVVAPTGQYYPSHLVNPGVNRWSFKPEVGMSRRLGNWYLDGYGAVWLSTANTDYLRGASSQIAAIP